MRSFCDAGKFTLHIRVLRGEDRHHVVEAAFKALGFSLGQALAELDATIDERADAGGTGSYTARLLADRNLRLKKIGEEASEFVTACADGDTDRANEEAADVFYHLLVALHAAGGSLGAVREALRSRR
jgi:phosphoribosyl-ATP pyrophosphohydrolase/phosphoribosyl-AMP cyclohydrolase